MVISDAWARGLALTFDDVQLKPGRTSTRPSDPSLATRFSRNIVVHNPWVSSPMDRVTEDAMAIALALHGGIGCIHFNCAIDAQAEMVQAVKNFQRKFVVDPAAVRPDHSIRHVITLQKQRRHKHYTRFFVLDDNGQLLGVTAKSDRKFSVRSSSDRVGDFMTPRADLVVAYRGVTANRAYKMMRDARKSVLPVVESETDNTLIGAYFFKDLAKTRDKDRPLTVDADGRLRVVAAVKADPCDLNRAEALAAAGVDAFVVDTSHGHTVAAIATAVELKKWWPERDVVSGNIATLEAARDLVETNCFDALRVGVGPGSICTTREELGMGVPQITAIHEAALGAGGEIPVIADGGMRKGGDVNKAIAAGAECCMFGNLFAGTDEAPCGEAFLHDGRLVCEYRGMGSDGAMEEGGAGRYNDDEERPLTQGVEGVVPYRGSVVGIIENLGKSLRHMMASVDARTIPSFQEAAEFFRQTHAGVLEGRPHDVLVTKAPAHML